MKGSERVSGTMQQCDGSVDFGFFLIVVVVCNTADTPGGNTELKTVLAFKTRF